jgi:hypothetical protein
MHGPQETVSQVLFAAKSVSQHLCHGFTSHHTRKIRVDTEKETLPCFSSTINRNGRYTSPQHRAKFRGVRHRRSTLLSSSWVRNGFNAQPVRSISRSSSTNVGSDDTYRRHSKRISGLFLQQTICHTVTTCINNVSQSASIFS